MCLQSGIIMAILQGLERKKKREAERGRRRGDIFSID
jgi:hypothetical protein